MGSARWPLLAAGAPPGPGRASLRAGKKRPARSAITVRLAAPLRRIANSRLALRGEILPITEHLICDAAHAAAERVADLIIKAGCLVSGRTTDPPRMSDPAPRLGSWRDDLTAAAALAVVVGASTVMELAATAPPGRA